MKNKQRGFTLIELLVVVLIIGILAAVALPQYQRAVLRSRVASLFPTLKALNDAQAAYLLANGNYAPSLDDLMVSLPECSQVSHSGVGTWYTCGKYNIHLYAKSNLAGVSAYGLIEVGSRASYDDSPIVWSYKLGDGKTTEEHCKPKINDDVAYKVCENMGARCSKHKQNSTHYFCYL